MKYRTETVPVDLVNRSVGISQSPAEIAKLLTRMCLKSNVSKDAKSVIVEIPPSRAGKTYFFMNGYNCINVMQILFTPVILLRMLL